jgi:hypothetical protein
LKDPTKCYISIYEESSHNYFTLNWKWVDDSDADYPSTVFPGGDTSEQLIALSGMTFDFFNSIKVS